jgi:hypothetical protein
MIARLIAAWSLAPAAATTVLLLSPVIIAFGWRAIGPAPFGIALAIIALDALATSPSIGRDPYRPLMFGQPANVLPVAAPTRSRSRMADAGFGNLPRGEWRDLGPEARRLNRLSPRQREVVAGWHLYDPPRDDLPF